MKDDLILNNTKLIYYVLKEMNLFDKVDEYYDIGLIGLVRAANNYKKETGFEFSTYAYTSIRNEILNDLRMNRTNKRKINHHTISLSKVAHESEKEDVLLEDYIASDVNVEEEVYHKLLLEELDKCIMKLPPRERICLIYNYGLYGVNKTTQTEIANELCLTQTVVSRSIKKAEKLLYNMLKDYGR